MPNLTTRYMGLTLKNPLVVASSRLTSTLEKISACEEAGAGAVVLKSLFEEQILSDSGKVMENLDPLIHAEAFDYSNVMSQEYYLDEYLKLVEDAKKRLSIPVIASLNCVSAGKWINYAVDFEKMGADGLELNVFVIPADARKDSTAIEQVYLDIARKIKQKVHIPVAMKIGPHFTAMAQVMKKLSAEGINALVLFNRFYNFDIDIEHLTIKAAKIYSQPDEIYQSLRWIALMSGELSCDMAATTGIHDAGGVVKQLLAGAKAVQLCSVLFMKGLDAIKPMLAEIEAWMERKKFSSLEDFNGMLCRENSENPEAYERSQYIKALVGIG